MNQEITFIKPFEKDFEKDIEDTETWLSLLMPLEHEVIEMLYKAPYPLYPKSVVDQLVSDLWDKAKKLWIEKSTEIEWTSEYEKALGFTHIERRHNGTLGGGIQTYRGEEAIMQYSQSHNLNEKETKKMYVGYQNSKQKLNIKVDLWENTRFPGKVETVLLIIHDIVTNIDYSKPPYSQIEQKKNNLLKNELVSIPDPRKIEKILIGLESLGIVASRELSGSNVKKLYALTPKARIVFKKVFDTTPQ